MSHEHAHDASAQASVRVKHLVAELERHNVLREEDLDDIVAGFLERAQPANGKRIVARAWVDPGFKARLLADANAAVDELGIDLSHWSPVILRAVENTDEVHNVIVCTLCSCYPIALLGPSPKWYKSEAYRSAAVRDPRAVLAQFGFDLPQSVRINVWDSTSQIRYIVLPKRPAGTDAMSEGELAALVSRDGLIGVAPL